MVKFPKAKDKVKILKAVRDKKQIIYEKAPVHLATDLSTETTETRREQKNVFKVLKETKQNKTKNLSPENIVSAKLSFTFEEEIKSFRENKS